MVRSAPRRSHFERLPVTVIHHIIAFLPEPRSIQSLSYTSWKIFYIIHVSKRRLLQQIMLTCMGGAQVVAMATWVYRCQPPQVISSADDVAPEESEDPFLTDKLAYADQFLETRPSNVSASAWPIQDAVEMCDFHLKAVKPLLDCFLDSCHDSSEILAHNLEKRPVSPAERTRAALALYGCELFRRLFGAARAPMTRMKPYYQSFFITFAPWESAQMSCVHDFLAGVVTSAISNLVAYSDEVRLFYNREIRGDSRLSSPHVQYYLTLGLEWLARLKACNSTLERYDLLKIGLHKHTKDYFWTSIFKSNRICSTKDEMERLIASEPLFAEADAGPQRIWHLSHMASKAVGSPTIYEDLDWRWRRWGYAIWDFERLWALGAVRRPWNHHSII